MFDDVLIILVPIVLSEKKGKPPAPPIASEVTKRSAPCAKSPQKAGGANRWKEINEELASALYSQHICSCKKK